MKVEPGEHIVVLGTTGSGKTFACRNLWLPLFSRCIIVDTEGMQFEDFPRVPVKRAIKLAKSDYSFYVRIEASGRIDEDEPLLDELCYGLLDKGHDLVIYLDEATDFSDARTIPPSLRQLIRKARKRKINVIVGTQRPAMLSKDYFANAQHRQYLFVSDYDAESVHDYAPFLRDRRSEIPYKSYRSLYQAPDETVHLLGPCPAFDWTPRLKRQKEGR